VHSQLLVMVILYFAKQAPKILQSELILSDEKAVNRLSCLFIGMDSIFGQPIFRQDKQDLQDSPLLSLFPDEREKTPSASRKAFYDQIE